MTGLRQLQRRRMHETISAAAIRLFLERGFEEVPVAEIAAVAGVSKPTLFKYFPTKEDLVLHRIADHQGEAARVVRGSAEPPLEALRRHFLDGLARHDPVTGLNDEPEVVAYHRMVFGTPSLVARLFHHMSLDERALAEALAERMDDLTAALVAGQVLATQRVLARRNWALLAEGRPLAEVEPESVRAAERAFALLSTG
ncbi:TetR family transcriptional regulator [Nonomuraea jiangxiensis]|uniref:DNA-binding transcriptional regulator, AcrR family n=1 Tax=Nonomuraea jiangxiensis TaxID=633440 RepID=A0A1G9DGC5_9ACTN|nr:TetR family transcriptional regulator [Nonomuraea jiangxiensis]SDK62913.1 DNA-binding transcriptional regulator, AcrR family [Nonomuraea jiangxiensis]